MERVMDLMNIKGLGLVWLAMGLVNLLTLFAGARRQPYANDNDSRSDSQRDKS